MKGIEGCWTGGVWIGNGVELSIVAEGMIPASTPNSYAEVDAVEMEEEEEGKEKENSSGSGAGWEKRADIADITSNSKQGWG